MNATKQEHRRNFYVLAVFPFYKLFPKKDAAPYENGITDYTFS